MEAILLDTHIFLWLTTNDPRLSAPARSLIEGSDAVFISAASIWEIAIKVRVGKLKADPAEMIDEIHANGFTELPIYARHVKGVAELPLHHGDPFDRLLVAQAISEQLRLLTPDALLGQYSEAVVTI